MSFLEEIKEELLNLKIKKSCCILSEIRGILTFGGAPFQGNVIFGTDNLQLAKKVSNSLRRCCAINYPERLDEEAESYKFLIPDDILFQLGLKSEDDIYETSDFEKDPCCMRSFVRGAFLASGSAASPDRAYRIEIFSENEKAVNKVLNILDQLGVDAKKTKRKNLYVVYANTSESSSDMLKVMEASMAVFKVLEAKVVKDKRNESNRQFNCDMANADRASANSYRESRAIHIIEKKIGLDALKPKLREAALLRLENEGASLKELCELFDPPMAKSTLNNRLNKLIQIAEELSD